MVWICCCLHWRQTTAFSKILLLNVNTFYVHPRLSPLDSLYPKTVYPIKKLVEINWFTFLLKKAGSLPLPSLIFVIRLHTYDQLLELMFHFSDIATPLCKNQGLVYTVISLCLRSLFVQAASIVFLLYDYSISKSVKRNILINVD